jgi:hypothetical protein
MKYSRRKIHHRKKGQTLIILLVFMMIAITVTSVTVTTSLVNTQNTDKMQEGIEALHVAQSGAENAMLRLLRDPTYAGETLTVGQGTSIITVTGTTTKTIVSIGKYGRYVRKVQIDVGNTNGILVVTPPWKEVF